MMEVTYDKKLTALLPNYAGAVVTTNEVVDPISGSRSERF
jgi:hypothetical protein